MEHGEHTTTEHIIAFSQQEANALGEWLLSISDHVDDSDAKHAALRGTPGFDLAMELADNLNGVN